ncbi:hypothetical protein J6590_033675 [Homalodisca vitripennis]|nr:hypothetical protein J6590_033675 [Homalodisca vitripennis]
MLYVRSVTPVRRIKFCVSPVLVRNGYSCVPVALSKGLNIKFNTAVRQIRYSMRNGYSCVPVALSKGLNIKLNNAVRQIRYSSKAIKVLCFFCFSAQRLLVRACSAV